MSVPKMLTLLPLALMLSGGVAAAEDKPVPPPATISINGSADLKLAPDAAVVTLGVSNDAKTAKDALAANTRSVAGIFEQVKSAGISDKDVRTSQFAINPTYATRKRADGREVSEVIGYQVSNLVTIRVAPIEKLGALLDGVVREGANRVNGLDFIIDGANLKLDEARAAAVADARRKAEIYVHGLGAKLGRVLSVSEMGGYQPPMMKSRGAVMAMEAAAAPVPVQAGEETLSASVSVTWEIVNEVK